MLTTHDLADIEELCDRLMIIDHGKVLFDGPLAELKRMLWRQTQIRLDLKDREQAPLLEALNIEQVGLEKVDELTYRLAFSRDDYSTGELIRRVVSAVDVREIFIEEESIEDIVKRIYTGQAEPVLQGR